MSRFALGIALLIGVVPAAAVQDSASQQPAAITLSLPTGIPSETVQINYFMIGPFGGYGGIVRKEKGRTSYDIVASVDGKPAVNVKVIAYLPGCEIETLEIPVQGTMLSRALSCKPLERISLHGQISPVSITQEQPTGVVVDYLALWDHKFFGIMDGMVTTIRLATIIPDQNGHFEIAIPDFHKQTNLGEGEFRFTLAGTKSGNIIAFLKPTDEDRDSQGLRVRTSYEPVIQFLADQQH